VCSVRSHGGLGELGYTTPPGQADRPASLPVGKFRRRTGPESPDPDEGGEYPTVSEVKVREGETFESALRRFNKKIKQNGILSEVRRREHYEKPSVRRKRKLVAAKKRRLKAG
jgi:small subunit ribosomal protein S21